MISKQKLVVFAVLIFGGFGVSESQYLASGDDSDEDERRTQQEDSLMIGTFQLMSDPSDPKFDAYLKEMEYDDDTRLMMHGLRPATLEFSKQGKIWTVKLITRLKNWEISFQSGVQFMEDLFDFRKAHTTVMVRENYMEKFQDIGKFEARQIVNFNKEGLKVTFIVHGNEVTQEFKRLGEDGSSDEED